MLRDRVVTALALVAAVIALLFRGPLAAWVAFATLVLALAAWEWGGFARCVTGARVAYAAVTVAVWLAIALASGLADGAAGFPGLVAVHGLALVFWIGGAPVWLARKPERAPALGILAIGWVVLLPTFLALVQLRNHSASTLILFMIVVWIADIAAYFAGRRFGRRKLAPTISPGKTWEGLYGALIATAVYAGAWLVLFPGATPSAIRDLPWSPVWMIGLIEALALLSVIGDLFESTMKRRAGLKDSGHLLPGHGGVLDRIDGLLPVLPAAALVSMA